MAHRLDVIAVRVEDEGGVVVRVVFGPETRLSIVTAAGRQGRAVKGVDRIPVGGGEGDVLADGSGGGGTGSGPSPTPIQKVGSCSDAP